MSDMRPDRADGNSMDTSSDWSTDEQITKEEDNVEVDSSDGSGDREPGQLGSDGMTPYEANRLANIRKNDELMALLNLPGIRNDLGSPSQDTVTPVCDKQAARTRKPSPRNDSPPAVLRRSSREKPTDRKRKAEEEEASKTAEDIARRKLDAELSRLRYEDIVLEEIGIEPHTILVHHSSVRPATDRSLTPSLALVDKSPEQFKQFIASCQPHSKTSQSGNRISTMAYHPNIEKMIALSGDCSGSVTISSSSPRIGNDDINEATSHQFQIHWPPDKRGSISCLRIGTINTTSILTSSKDRTMRSTSLEKNISEEIFRLEEDDIRSFDQSPSGSDLWIADSAGWLNHIDTRSAYNRPSHGRRYHLGNASKASGIYSVSVNPVLSHILAVTSDEILQIWDVRNLAGHVAAGDASKHQPSSSNNSSNRKKAPKQLTLSELLQPKVPAVQKRKKPKKTLLPPVPYSQLEVAIDKYHLSTVDPTQLGLRGQLRHYASVISASWDPSGRRLLSTSHDNFIRLWDFDLSSIAERIVTDDSSRCVELAHDLQTGQYVTPMQACWLPLPVERSQFVVGTAEGNSLEIIDYQGQGTAQLRDAVNVNEVQAVVASHPSAAGYFVSGDKTGVCTFWAPASPIE